MRKIPRCNSLQGSTAGVVIWLALVFHVPIASAQSVVTVEYNGDPDNRVDLAIMGDGYTSADMGKYANDVEQTINGFFSEEPFGEYRRYFNIHRIDTPSNESGADHPERNPPSLKDTAFDAGYNCGGIQRLICVNTSKVLTEASNALSPAERDIILVLVNDSEYGGSGGTVAVASTHPTVVELFLHELGHSFGLLGDEYFTPPPPECNLSYEPSQPNLTMQNQRGLIKWNVWIDDATPVPTLTTMPGVPGLYEGAQYCVTGKYRPTYNSKMRSLNRPYEQINTEQLIKRIYNWVSPIDSSSPSITRFRVARGWTQLFSVTPPLPLSHDLNVSWLVDGQPTGTGTDFVFDSSEKSVGLHTIEAVVEDNTSSVRNDPGGILLERRRWDVIVENTAPERFQLRRRGRDLIR